MQVYPWITFAAAQRRAIGRTTRPAIIYGLHAPYELAPTPPGMDHRMSLEELEAMGFSIAAEELGYDGGYAEHAVEGLAA